MSNEKNYTDKEFQKAFQQILKFYKSRYFRQENPKVFLLGGQPGAGKSGLEIKDIPTMNLKEVEELNVKCKFLMGIFSEMEEI